MSTNTMRMDAAPDEIFAVLAAPETYRDWVVGCDNIRAAEGEWPAVDSKFHHTVGFGPLKLEDNTKVLEVVPGRRLVLEARARPAGVANVVFELAPADEGTEVTIVEYPVRGFANAIHNPLLNGLIFLRNAETLRRLNKLVQKRRSGAPLAGG